MARPKGSKTKKANPGRTGGKWTLTEREGLKAEVARLDRRGFNQYQIVEQIGAGRISQGTVCNMLKEIQADYEAAYVDNRKAKAVEAEAALREVNAECWAQIERLKERGRKKVTTKSGSGDQGSWAEDAETVEDADIGGYLTLISKNWAEILAIHGVKALPEQVFAVVNVHGRAGTEGVFNRLLESTLAAIGAGGSGGPRVVVEPGAVGDAETPPAGG